MKCRSIFLPLTIALLIISCKNKSDDAVVPPPKLVKLQTSAALGSYLNDKDGNTLYYFSNDFDGNINCAGGCLAVWPPYYAGDDFTSGRLGDGLNFSDFGAVTAGGTKQTTYKGWPLYYYAPVSNGVNTRELPGETKGEGVGAVWYVAKPNYTIMITNAQLVGNNGRQYKSDYTEGTGRTAYFTDQLGRTLYGFVRDSFNINKYTKSDFSNNATWPLYEQDTIVVPSTLDKNLFGSITVFGKKQMTYKGWPLYYFGPDSLIRGRNKGVSVPAPGVWPVIVKGIAEAPKK
jgi:predicted lipoprotein with Yx(FWY)xxD motif